VLFKEKLLLSNCDSARKLSSEEVRKRFLTGLTFADGVVLTPNVLIDNVDVHKLIARKNVVKYLNEEGYGKFIVRGFGLNGQLSLIDYFNNLPDDFIFASLRGNPVKSEVSGSQLDMLLTRLELTQDALNRVNAKVEPLSITKDSLRDEICVRISDELAVGSQIGNFFDSDGERALFVNQSSESVSRSHWYRLSDKYFGKKSQVEAIRFKTEIIDPAYNSLFAVKGEGFLQDNIKVINDIPEVILDAGVTFKSLRNEIKYIEYPIKAFELISSLGAGELAGFLTDEAMGYVEGKFKDKGEGYLSRKNWFGMYDVMKNKIGLEVK